MKTLSLIFSFDPASGGPLNFLMHYRTILRRQGYQVDMVSMDDPEDPIVKELGEGVYALGPGKGKYLYNSKLGEWLKEHHHEYEKVIIHGLWQYQSFGAWRVLHGTKTPYYIFTHGMLDPWFKRTYFFKHLKKWLYWPWAEYRVLRDAEAVLFTCEEERRLARQSFWLYRCNEKVITYGAAAPDGDKVMQKELFLKTYPECRDKHCIVYLGRIHEKKGCDLLMKAFAKQLELTPDVQLIMAGPCHHPDYLDMLKKLAPANVTWTGMLTGDLKWGALHASEAFILPSHQENFGVAVVEALAAGLPVLISDQVNIWREIIDDRAGFVAQDTLEGTIDLFRQWFQLTEDEQAEMSKRAITCFNSRFEIEQAVASFSDAIGLHLD